MQPCSVPGCTGTYTPRHLSASGRGFCSNDECRRSASRNDKSHARRVDERRFDNDNYVDPPPPPPPPPPVRRVKVEPVVLLSAQLSWYSHDVSAQHDLKGLDDNKLPQMLPKRYIVKCDGHVSTNAAVLPKKKSDEVAVLPRKKPDEVAVLPKKKHHDVAVLPKKKPFAPPTDPKKKPVTTDSQEEEANDACVADRASLSGAGAACVDVLIQWIPHPQKQMFV